ncbi:four helix bundle protein [Vibrio sp. WXL210]|uniref:four helix bundle protein n=1 Tax=Vibrio sp. WXL210 TaxID=3450709 RepID=UPI003EC5379B
MTYESLEVWQRSVDLSAKIYQVMRSSRDFGFKDQICRSSVSVSSNIAEGCERIHIREKINFLSVAKGSLGELKTQVIIGERIGLIPKEVSECLTRECEELSKMLGSLITYNLKQIKH